MSVALLSLALLLAAPSQDRPAHLYAVIVGNNQGLTAEVRPLRYADDDAVHYAELVEPLAAQVHLLTVMDRETQLQHPALALRAIPPTHAALQGALAEIDRAIGLDMQQGLSSELFFVFVGHGGVAPDGEGYVALLDGKLTRTELFQEVVRPSRATRNHLIVDACDSYFLVSSRGSPAADDRGPDRSAAIRSYLSNEELAAFPNTGALVSTSGDRESHEWSVYRGGVFSHAVLSAMAGAADVNGDGAIDYSEVGAFLQAMSARVTDPRGRLDVYVRPPAQALGAPLWRLGGYRRFLRLGARLEGRYFVEGPDGSRFADFNKAAGAPLVLGLPQAAGSYRLIGGGREADVREGPLVADASRLVWEPSSVGERGDLASALSHGLFQVPFGPAFYAGFVAADKELIPAPSDVPAFLPEILGKPPTLPFKDPFGGASP